MRSDTTASGFVRGVAAWIRSRTGLRLGNTLSLASRNIFRHGVRTLLTLFVIAAGVAGLILTGGFVEDALTHLREATIHSQLGHLQVYRAGYYENGSRSPYKYTIETKKPLVDLLEKNPDVTDVMARLAFVGVVNNGRSDFAVIGEGVEPDRENRLGSLVQFVAGRNLTQADRYGMTIGEGVASATKLKGGDHATLVITTADGALNSIEFEVVGVFRSFSRDFDAHAVRVSLEGAQELLDTQGVNAIVVLLDKTERTDAVAKWLVANIDAKTYEVRTWGQLADFYDKTATLYRRQFAVLQAIILIAVVLSVVNGVNMSIFERTGEFGTLMALGTRGRAVFRLVLLENVLLGLIGSTAGLAIGIVASIALTAIGIPMPPPPNSSTGYVAGIQLDASIIIVAWSIGFIATGLAAILPARRVSRIPVVEALRQN